MEDMFQLSEEQLLILNMSDDDILNGRFITQENLDKSDLEWLKTLSTTYDPYNFH